MEASQFKTEANPNGDVPLSMEQVENAERVLKFSASFKDKMAPLANSGTDRANPPKRDWSSALDLVNEAFEAIRIAEERAVAAEDYHQQLVQHHKEQVRALESRLATSEKRAETAEARAKDAETWLAKFHDTIVDGFQRTFVAK